MPALTTIGFDADDTLWQNERFFQLTEARFREMLADHADAELVSSRLLEPSVATSATTVSASRASSCR